MSTQKIVKIAKEIGFSLCGVAKACELPDEKEHLQKWIKAGNHAKMQWIEKNLTKRVNPTKLVEGAKSVIVVALNYFPPEQQSPDVPQIAKYAYGKDYHYVIKDMLAQLLERINREVSICSGRYFVDSAPVMERQWAVKAGLGWIGKNSLLITKEFGSYVLLGELIIDLELQPSKPFMLSHCGTCTQCISMCPTNAILSEKSIDSRKCLSYWTIEHKGDFNEQSPASLHNRVFGCDICQDCCPWNKKALPHFIDEFTPHEMLLSNTKEDWNNITAQQFGEIFRGSAVKRTKFKGFCRNMSHIQNNNNALLS